MKIKLFWKSPEFSEISNFQKSTLFKMCNFAHSPQLRNHPRISYGFWDPIGETWIWNTRYNSILATKGVKCLIVYRGSVCSKSKTNLGGTKNRGGKALSLEVYILFITRSNFLKLIKIFQIIQQSCQIVFFCRTKSRLFLSLI